MDMTTPTPDTEAEPVAANDLPPAGTPGSPQDKPQESLSTDEAIAKAMAQPGRADDGKFAGKEPRPEAKVDDKPAKAENPAEATKDVPAPKEEPAPAKARVDAPARFNEQAKAEWANVPEQVQHEVARALREMESGIADYKTKATDYETRDVALKPFRDMAEKAGVKIEDALKNYTDAETALHENPARALAQMAQQYMPGGLEALMREWTGQTQADPRDQQLVTLQRELAHLREGVQQNTQTMEQQRAAQAAAANQQVIDQFAAAHPRVDELQDDMARLIQTGFIDPNLPIYDRLSQAYEAAARLKPALEPEPAPPPAPAPQTRYEPTSLTGAPSGGSYPRGDEVLSTDEAIQRAMRRR